MAKFMGYEMGGLATPNGGLYGYEVVDKAGGGESLSGDDQALLHFCGGGAAAFSNGSISPVPDGYTYSLRSADDYRVVAGRWVQVS